MIIESVEHGLLIWPTVEENGVIRTKKYTELFADEREYKLYDAFDKFTHIKRESLHMYYLRFTQLINDINIYNMKMEQFQVNTKFLNSLPPEWSKFMIDVKLVKDLHTSNYDQLHAYLEQHEPHANEVCLMRDDPIACHNKAMAFLTAVASSRFPSTNNQLRTSSNIRKRNEDLYTYYSDCDDLSNAQAILMANISNYGSDVISERSESCEKCLNLDVEFSKSKQAYNDL
uniref:Integrase, catalytic region, zinc finger, CCHC-type, peptidase aspartic, catalytic n=1 Tax=Tanacetum cinerariifolium TaxID=118510 RepID=A0A6L2NX78_TANCI|nr:integrase, catalytic region, zinc finger, CCHC-type, peptidase aspartic, catalytic [Tanacetum cinerariifolium]